MPSAATVVACARRAKDLLRVLVTATGAVRDCALPALLDVLCEQVVDLTGAEEVLVSTVRIDSPVGWRVAARAGSATPTWHVGSPVPDDSPLVTAEPPVHPDDETAGSLAVVPLGPTDAPHGMLALRHEAAGIFPDHVVAAVRVLVAVADERLAGTVEALRGRRADGPVLDTLDEAILVLDGLTFAVQVANRVAHQLGVVELVRVLVDGRGATAGELVDAHGRPMPLDRTPVARAVALGVAVRDAVVKVRRPGYPERCFGVTATPVTRPGSGEVMSIVCRVRDVAEERRSRARAEDPAERLAAAQRMSGLGWWEYDVATNTTLVSREVREIAGMDPDDTTPDHGTWLARIHPDDRSLLDWGRLQGDGRPEVEVFRVVRPDGTLRVVQSWTAREFDDHGGLRRVSGATLDVTDRDRALAALADTEDQFRSAFDESPIGMMLLDLRGEQPGRLLRVNSALVDLLGHDHEDQLLGQSIDTWTAWQVLPDELDRLQRLASGELVTATYETRCRRRDGSVFPALVTAAVSGLGSGRPLLLNHVVDRTEQVEATRRAARGEEMFRAAFDHAPTGMLVLSGDPARPGRVLRVNQALADLMGCTAEEAVGVDIGRFLEAGDREPAAANLSRLARGGVGPGPTHRRLLRLDGTVRDVLATSTRLAPPAPGEPAQILTHVMDITGQLEQQRKLEQLALRDPLTGVGNREQLERWLAEAVTRPRPGTTALLLMDLDRFKLLNDTLGHAAGDALLRRIGGGLAAAGEHRWRTARFGGDEFVVLVDGLADGEAGEQAAAVVARELLDLVTAARGAGSGPELGVSATVGVALVTPEDDETALLRRADLALYAAKADGRNRFQLCDAALLRRMEGRMRPGMTLRSAGD